MGAFDNLQLATGPRPVSNELVDLSLGATWAGAVPAGAIVTGLTARVTSAVTGATTFDIGDGSDVDRWGAAIAPTITTTTNSSDWTDTAIKADTAAKDIVLTPNGGAFTGGNVRLTVHYLLANAV